MENKAITRQDITAIKTNAQMRPYIKTEEQRLRWFELLMKDFPIKREDGSPALTKKGKPIVKRKTFEGARLAFFEEFYGFGKKQRAIELEALTLFGEKIEEQKAATT